MKSPSHLLVLAAIVWNEYVIKLDGSNIEVHLNGELVSTSDDMSKLTRGYIGFQAEDGFHEYRNLRIKDLSHGLSRPVGFGDVDAPSRPTNRLNGPFREK